MAAGKLDFSEGTRVVYPNQGVCRVIGKVEMTIGGQSATFLKLARENDDGTVMIPLAKLKDVGVRQIAGDKEVAQLFALLSTPDLGPDLNWKTRHRSHGERMAAGDVFAMAEVLKELAALSDLRPLPAKERELYDNARHLLVSEIAAALGVPETSAEDAIDFALFPPGLERKKLAAMALDALVNLDDGDLDLDDEDLLEVDEDSIDEDGEEEEQDPEEDDLEDSIDLDEESGLNGHKAPTSTSRKKTSSKPAAPAKASKTSASKSKSSPAAKKSSVRSAASEKAPKATKAPSKKASSKDAPATTKKSKPSVAKIKADPSPKKEKPS